MKRTLTVTVGDPGLVSATCWSFMMDWSGCERLMTHVDWFPEARWHKENQLPAGLFRLHGPGTPFQAFETASIPKFQRSKLSETSRSELASEKKESFQLIGGTQKRNTP